MTGCINSSNSTASDSDHLALSIVIPVFNEEDNLELLYKRLTETLMLRGGDYELLFIDDGSKDDSFVRLYALHTGDARVRIVRLVHNFGQQMAVAAGLRFVRGDVVVLIDADLQTAPEDIPLLVDKLSKGYDIVYGTRTKRVDPAWRRLGSWGAGMLLAGLTGVNKPDNATGFLALDRRFVETLNLYNEKTKYLSGLIAWLSYGRWIAVPVSHAPRHAGTTKYSLRKLVALTINLVCNFSMAPLQAAFPLGLALAGLAATALVGLGVLGLFGEASAPRFLVSIALFLAGLELTAIGIIGNYVGRIYREVRRQPHYVIREVLGTRD